VLTYSIIVGNDGDAFNINSGDGLITLKNAVSLSQYQVIFNHENIMSFVILENHILKYAKRKYNTKNKYLRVEIILKLNITFPDDVHEHQ